ncbi:MAG: hypothetical protein HYS26_02645 [Candidatus Kaiserbacteria bacterium]|nr:MAG: hypothetical protein HYS26_02645 [Candidatus Kaiserbacteria bacterium]
MKDPYHIQKTALRVTRWVGSPGSLAAHTVIFIAAFLSVEAGYAEFEDMLLILTTIVSLEAIYLAIFIQMTINYTTQSLQEVGEDIEELQEDIGEIQEDMGEIQEDVGELQEDVEEISEDVEEMTEEEATEEAAEEARKAEQRKTLTDIQGDLRKLMDDISKLQQPRQ